MNVDGLWIMLHYGALLYIIIVTQGFWLGRLLLHALACSYIRVVFLLL